MVKGEIGMSEIDIIKIIIQVFINFPLIMTLALIIDFEHNNKYDIEFEVIDYEERKSKNSLLIRIVEKLNELVNGK